MYIRLEELGLSKHTVTRYHVTKTVYTVYKTIEVIMKTRTETVSIDDFGLREACYITDAIFEILQDRHNRDISYVSYDITVDFQFKEGDAP